METLGRHFLVEMRECSVAIINDRVAVEQAMLGAARASGMTVVTNCFHSFNPHGVSGVVVIAESHIAVHAWPEYEYAAVDVFTCGNEGSPEKAVEHLTRAFGAKTVHVVEVIRGQHLPMIVHSETRHPPG